MNEGLYKADFYAWTQFQSAKLKAKCTEGGDNSLDWLELAEEVACLGRIEKREARRLAGKVMLGLLRWQILTGRRSGSFQNRVAAQRHELQIQLRENPSLLDLLPDLIVSEYALVRLRFSAKSGLPLHASVERCPFTVEQILDTSFFPDAASNG